MKKQSIALTALALLASSASYGCHNSYNFYFGCDEQRKGTPMARCHNMAPVAMPTDSTQQQHAKLGKVAVEFLNTFLSKVNVAVANPGTSEDSFDAPTPAQIKELVAAEKTAVEAEKAKAKELAVEAEKVAKVAAKELASARTKEAREAAEAKAKKAAEVAESAAARIAAAKRRLKDLESIDPSILTRLRESLRSATENLNRNLERESGF